ncbi:MAG: multiheme c-type cytochrome [Candidatus Thiodiazotropha sp.]
MHPAIAETEVENGPFNNSQCINCHSERNPQLITQWQAGPHAASPDVGCNSCHGALHQGSNNKARGDHTCIGCHEGSASHSYTTSKHGVITRLEEEGQDREQPLQRGNYRAPGCSYCHLHDSNHNDSMSQSSGPEMRHWVCSGCHSPRFVREQLANGKQQLKIADLKVAEGEALIAAAADNMSHHLEILRQRLLQHRQNILYGVGHQSPDYQWWHGQPALDGDLIRIRDSLLQIQQRQRVTTDHKE